MFDGRGDDVFTFCRHRMRHGFDRRVVGFSRATGENNIIRLGVDGLGNRFTRGIEFSMRSAAKAVAQLAGGIEAQNMNGLDECRTKSATLWLAAMYPPRDANDLENVPMMTSTSSVSPK